MAGVSATTRAEIAGRSLPGRDFSPVLTNPGAADLHATRDAILFTYSGLGAVDSGIWQIAAEAKAAGKRPALAVLKQGYLPNLQKRGNVRTVFDGRYKFTRYWHLLQGFDIAIAYFSPLDHNSPSSIDELYAANDVELFDLSADPGEMVNLGAEKATNRELIEAMSAKLERQIKAEIGSDDGRELPDFPRVTWTIDRIS